MSFEKMQNINAVHERSCLIAYQFSANEIRAIQNVARLTGVKDIIVVTEKNCDTKVQDILENKLSENTNKGIKEKALIFNNIAATRMNAFIEGLKKMRVNRPLIAVVTEHSINWTLKELVINLNEERSAFKNNQQTIH